MSEAGADIALLICALFLQRFTLTFGNSLMSLDIVPAAFILLHQFARGRLLIQYDRLLWFLALGLAASCSLLLNFQSLMLPSYCLFLVVYFLFTLARTSTPDRYLSTLVAFQFLVALISFLAAVQFAAQFVIDGKQLIQFYGIFPDFLFTDRFNTIIPVTDGSALIKSNGLFLTEPSTLSQIAAVALLIEIIQFRRIGYLLLLALALLLSYSGTGLVLILVFLPLAGIRYTSAQLPAVFVSLFAVALFATGIIDLSAFSSRVGEFDDTQASAFQRFISSFWMAGEHIDTASLSVLLRGSGSGTMDGFAPRAFYAAFGGTWFKLFYEYGVFGSFVFLCFLASCFRNTNCPKLLIAAMFFYYMVLGGLLLSTPFLIIMIVLCTLSAPASRDDRVDISSRFQPSLIAGSSGG